MPPLKIGTRGSPLALAQARETRARLMAAHGLGESDIEIVTITTTGDRIRDRPLAEIGGKGLFTKEIEEALLAGEIHLAVHSMKDMPAIAAGGPRHRRLPAARGCARCASSAQWRSGSSICRRARSSAPPRCGAPAQLLRLRPDLKIVPFRGNVETRLQEARGRRGAGDAPRLRRAQPAGPRADTINADPHRGDAAGRGARRHRHRNAHRRRQDATARSQRSITAKRRCASTCERAFLAALDGSCRTPLAGHAIIENDALFVFAAKR